MSSTLQPYRHYYVGPEFEHARVHDVMRVGVVTCQPDTSLRDVARIMVGYQIHSLVVDNGAGSDATYAILTDLEIAQAAGADMADVSAGDIATSELVTVTANEPLAAAAKLMAEHRCTHLVAVQPETGRPVGVVSALGIASVIAAGQG
jgi:CBS domain-containing protein